jgi:hypothetical protein
MMLRTTVYAAGVTIALAAVPLAAQENPHAGHGQPAPTAAPAAAPARPAQRQAIASPRDTAEATIGGARVMVDYGRPYKRGRQIYGNLVPTNSVWRTGANAATTLVTARPLRMGSTTVPAGTYTLYSLWTGSKWNLIINKQTGQWGTEYDQKQDLVRIPLTAAPLSSPVEQFTIAIEPAGDGNATLALRWGDRQMTAPIVVK